MAPSASHAQSRRLRDQRPRDNRQARPLTKLPNLPAFLWPCVAIADLAKLTCGKWVYIDLLDDDTEEEYSLRPQLLLEQVRALKDPGWVVIDEIQKRGYPVRSSCVSLRG